MKSCDSFSKGIYFPSDIFEKTNQITKKNSDNKIIKQVIHLSKVCRIIFNSSVREPIGVTGGRGTSRILKFTANDNQYICRITDPSRPSFFIDTTSEILNNNSVNKINICPRVHYSNECYGIIIMDSIKNAIPEIQKSEDKNRQIQLYISLAQNLRALHSGPTFAGETTSIFKDVSDAATAGSFARMPLAAHQVAIALSEIKAVVEPHQKSVACHKELTANNVLYDGKQAYFIDWESSSNCDPFVDLAIVANFFIFNETDEEIFLNNYFSAAMTPEQKAHFFLMKQVIHCLYAFKYFRRVANEVDVTEHLDYNSLKNYKAFILEYFTGCSKTCGIKEFNMFAHIFLREAVRNIESEHYRQAIELLKNSEQTHSRLLSPVLQRKIKNVIEKIAYIYNGVKEGGRPLIPYYHPEFVDPLHRRGRLMEPFFDAWKESESIDSYDIWLHKLDMGQEVPGKDVVRQKQLIGSDERPIPILGIQYLNEKQRQAYEMQVDDKGRMFTKQNNGLFHSADRTKDNSYIFVISLENNVYIGKFQRGTFGHPSFLAGKVVRAAGYFIFEHGELRAISDDSGHYNGVNRQQSPLPTKQMMIDTIKVLISKGVEVSSAEVIFTESKENASLLLATDLIAIT